MNITLKLKEVHAISNALMVFQGKQKPKLRFAIAQNQEKIAKTIQSIHAQYEECVPKSYKEYETEREKIMNAYRTELGLSKNEMNFGDKSTEVEEKIMKLASGKYNNAIQEFETAMKEFDEFLLEEIELNLQPLKIDFLPNYIGFSTFEALRPLIKDVYKFEKFQFSKVDISKFNIFRTISMLGEMNQMGIGFPTKVIHRLSYFMNKFKDEAKDVLEKRNEHARIPEFAEYQHKKTEISRDLSLTHEQANEKIKEIEDALDPEVLASCKKAEDEMAEIAKGVVQLEIPKIKLDMLEDDIDEQLFSALSPLIDGDED